MKKILKFFRRLLIFIGWTWFFTILSNTLIALIWNFDFLSARSWNLLSQFWNNGGVIKTTSDILLLSTLLLLPLLWITGYVLALKFNYIKIFLSPLRMLDNLLHRNKNTEPERIVLKNMKPNQQFVEDIKTELASIKPEKAKKAGDIRSEITQKLSQEIKK